ncbi:MAG: outer membrane protein assembly factor BamD [Thiotrichales bacterium]|nr:outer membrane protein assembly factor BamD [Thiotrichales bacterium]
MSRHYIDNFPTDQRIPQALLSITYAHYQLGDIESSAKITSNFIGSKKSHASLDYAFYLHGLARYSAVIKKL